MTPFIASLVMAYFAAWCGWQAYSRGNRWMGNVGLGGTILALTLWSMFPATGRPLVILSAPYVAHENGLEVHSCQCNYVRDAIVAGESLIPFQTLSEARSYGKVPHECVTGREVFVMQLRAEGSRLPRR